MGKDGPLMLFGIFPLSLGESKGLRKIWAERNATAKRLDKFVHKPINHGHGKMTDHDCSANDPQDGCVGCLEVMINKGDTDWDAFKETSV